MSSSVLSGRLSTLGGSSTGSSASLINTTTREYAEQPTRQVDARLLEYLGIEMLDVISDAATLRMGQLRRKMEDVHLGFGFDAPAPLPDESPEAKAQKHRDELHRRLTDMGYRVGWSLAERLSKSRAPFTRVPPPQGQAWQPNQIPPYEPLELVKFLCKDIWIYLYDKQIDNLRTNHRGVFVLHDNAFKPLLRFSCSSDIPGEREAMLDQCLQMLYLPSGIIKGVLASLGLAVSVTPEIGANQSCSFQIKTVKSA